MTTRWPRRSTACTRPRSSIGVPGRTCRRLNWPRWTGWTGSTIADCWGRSGTSHLPRPKRSTISKPVSSPWRRDSHQRVSGIPGAVQDSYLESSVTGASTNSRFKTTTTTSTYDAAGRRTRVVETTPIPDQDSLESRRTFSYNADGQITWRKDEYKDDGVWKQGRDEGSVKLQNIAPRLISQEDWNALTKTQREQWYDRQDNHRMAYVNGQLVATQDEAGKLDVLGQLSGFDSGTPGKGQVQVQQGENLRSLARRVYGNDQLWYVIADANGLEADASLVAGSTLNVPEVTTRLNDASTIKPYDQAELTGPTTSSLPYIPPPDQGCGQIGVLIMAVVAVVVSVVTYGAASSVMAAWQAGALAGAASSAAGQVVGNMAGVVDGFSFKDIALGAVTGAISAGVSSSLTGGKEGLKAS